MDNRGSMPLTVINMIAVMMRTVMMVMRVSLIAVIMVMIIVAMMNVGMIPAVMAMPGHGCEFLLAQRSVLHETQRGIEIDNPGIGAQSPRNQRCSRVAEPHAFRRLPAHREPADKSRAIGIPASRGVDHLDFV